MTNKMVGALFLLKLSVCEHGFLLNTNIARNTSDHQYLRMSDYYDDQRIQQQKLDNKMAVLVSQVQATFASLENKITDHVKENKTSLDLQACEDKYHELNVTFEKLELNFKKLEASFNKLMTEHSVQNTELDALRSKTNQCENEIANLNMLKNIQPIQEINDIRIKVQGLIKQARDNNVTQLARKQDFLALYNETVAITASQRVLRQHFTASQKAYRDFVASQKAYQDLVALKNESSLINQTIWNYIHTSHTKDDKVGLTACVQSSLRFSVETLTFPNIRSQIGIRNINAFRSSGKFICEKEGIYLILVSIATQSQNPQFRLYKNESIISWGVISSDTNVDTGTFHAVLRLQINDYVYIKSVFGFTDYSGFSCMTIIKVT